jgi:hypothetical protein
MHRQMDMMSDVLDRSRATEEFKNEIAAFVEHRPSPRIVMTRHSPRVKVLRVIAQLLAAEPKLQVERVQVDGWSGCSDFRGRLTAEAGGISHTFDFVWDCQWRAMQEGWLDCFGLPDQIRAARVFGWQCFSQWRQSDAAAEPLAAQGASR